MTTASTTSLLLTHLQTYGNAVLVIITTVLAFATAYLAFKVGYRYLVKSEIVYTTRGKKYKVTEAKYNSGRYIDGWDSYSRD